MMTMANEAKPMAAFQRAVKPGERGLSVLAYTSIVAAVGGLFVLAALYNLPQDRLRLVIFFG